MSVKNQDDDGVLVDSAIINTIWRRFFWLVCFHLFCLVAFISYQMTHPPTEAVNNFLSELISLFSTTINILTTTLVAALGAWAGSKAQKAMDKYQQVMQQMQSTNRKEVIENQMALVDKLEPSADVDNE